MLVSLLSLLACRGPEPVDTECPLSPWYLDVDADGFGVETSAVSACVAPAGHVAALGDCDDTNATLNPAAAEICDLVDNNCDTQVDEGVAKLWYRDGDADGFGMDADTRLACVAPSGYSGQGGDCDDADAAVNPGMTATPVWYRDDDADTYGRDADPVTVCVSPEGYADRGGDCDDDNANVSPGVSEVEDGRDNDCDGRTDTTESLVFVVERHDGELKAFEHTTGELAWAVGGLGPMAGLARSPTGDLYVSRSASGAVSEVTPDGWSASTDVVTGLTNPHGLWFDPATNTLLIATLDGTILEYDPASDTTTTLATLDMKVLVVAVRRPGADLLYVSDVLTDTVYTVQGQTLTPLATVPRPLDIAFGAGDKLWVSTEAGEIWEVDAETGVSAKVAGGFVLASGICLDVDNRSLFVNDYGAFTTYRRDPAGTQTTFTTELLTPWSCKTEVASDRDEDGFFSYAVGGDDCDDYDASTFPGNGC